MLTGAGERSTIAGDIVNINSVLARTTTLNIPRSSTLVLNGSVQEELIPGPPTQHIVTYTTDETIDTSNWIGDVIIEAWGAGGAGDNDPDNSQAGGGGSYAKSTVDAAAIDSSTLTVTFTGSITIVQDGLGNGPVAPNGDSGPSGGSGGNSGTGDVTFDGGSGGGFYGGGGGSAGPAANGNNGAQGVLGVSSGTGAVAVTGGGAGGNGSIVGNGQDGANPGGGGGSATGTPGSGGPGKVVITYTE